MVSKYQKLIKNSVLFAISSFGSKIMIFLLMPLYTRTLSTDEMGIADAVYATCTVILYIVSFTISEATMRFSKMEDVKKEKVLVNSLAVWMISVGIMMSISFLLKKTVFFAPYFLFIFLIVVFQNFYMIISQYARGSEKIRVFSVGGIIQTLFLVLGNIVFLLYFKWGIEGYLLAYIISFIVSGIYLAFGMKIYHCFKIKYFEKTLIVRMVRYSVPLVFTGLSWWILNASDKYVILYYIGASANGIYSIAHKIPTIIIAINGFFNSAWQLSAIDEQKSSDNEVFYNKVFYSYSAILYLLASGIILLSKYVMPILITSDYYASIQYIPVLVMSSLLQVYGNFLGGLNIAYQKTRNLVSSAIMAGIVNLVLNIILTPRIGMYGTAIATCIGCAVMIIMRLIDAAINLRIKFRLNEFILSMVLIGVQIILFGLYSYIGEILQVVVILLVLLLYKDFYKKIMEILKLEGKRVFHR